MQLRRQRQATLPAELEIQVVGKGEMPSWRVRVLRARGSEAPAVEFTEETMAHLLDTITRELEHGERRKRWGAERAEEDRVKSQYAGVCWCYAQKAWLAKKPYRIRCQEPTAQTTKKLRGARTQEDGDQALEVSAAAFASDRALPVVAPALTAS